MMRPHPPLSWKPPGSHAPMTQLSELRASLEADGHLQRKTGSPGGRCRSVHQMAGDGAGFGDTWRCAWDAVGVTLAGGKGSVTGMTMGVGAVKYSLKMLDQEDLGEQGGSGQKGELCSPGSHLGHGVGRCHGHSSLPSPPSLSPSLLLSLPSSSLLPSSSPPLLLSLSGSVVPTSGCSYSQSSTRLLEGPWGKVSASLPPPATPSFIPRVWPGSTLYQEHPL